MRRGDCNIVIVIKCDNREDFEDSFVGRMKSHSNLMAELIGITVGVGLTTAHTSLKKRC